MTLREVAEALDAYGVPRKIGTLSLSLRERATILASTFNHES